MATLPGSLTTYNKITKAVTTVKTKSGLAALTIVLLFLCFVFALFLAKDLLQWVLSILSLVFLVAFAAYSIEIARTE
jgi:hypothetical protein